MDGLPSDLVAYRRSPEFDQNTLPAALQRQHSTKAGAWALIHVVEGKLLYRILEPFGEIILEPGQPGVVQPEQLHEVHPIGSVRLFVEFFHHES
jgi:tellurite resistance-related uncharacterized protein